MKNKLPTNARIAIFILVLVIAFCSWSGRKIYNYLRSTPPDATENTSTTERQPPVPSRAPNSAEQAQQIYLALGNPSNADSADPNNYLLASKYFILSYNRAKAIPNWAAWRISKSELGDFLRPESDPFRPDERIPESWDPVKPSDYTGSGFDRGHVTPSADRSASEEAMSETFLMSNMTPQTGDLNRGPWQKLEAYLRTLVTRGSDVYIYAGAYGSKGKIKKKVTIPTNSWKIAVVVPRGASISAINQNTRVIAVDMPNVKGIKSADWQTYRTTVNQIEQRTGYNFFSTLPQDVQTALKNNIDKIDD